MSSEPHDNVPRLKWPDEIDEMFGRANPNPERLGCPTRDVLAALAKRQRPITDPAYDHLSKCSPCYLEVRALQQEHSLQRQRRLRVWSAAAVLALLTAALGWFLVRNT
jgi:hypothetical protein